MPRETIAPHMYTAPQECSRLPDYAVLIAYAVRGLRAVALTQEQQAQKAVYDYKSRNLKINIAAGPDCPTRCEGCYNFFGDSMRGDRRLVSADDVVGFAEAARADGIAETTIYGGDPLHHPEITTMLQGLKNIGMRVKLDTVGTRLLGPTRIVYKGRGVLPQIDIAEIAPYVDAASIPVDGSQEGILSAFRKGRSGLLLESLAIAALFRRSGVPFGVNTVANAANIHDLGNIKRIAQEAGASEWQVFEYDYEGPNPSSRRDVLKLEPGQFEVAAQQLMSESSSMKISFKSFDGRAGSYFMVDDAGDAYLRTSGGGREIIGHITHERDVVLAALHAHNERRRAALKSKAVQQILRQQSYASLLEA